mgnify:CR=1 FL=1
MFVIVWLILCAVVAGFADSKGRSAVGWFFLAVIISPLIAGIALALSKDLKTDTRVDNVERRTDNLEQEVKFNQRYNDLRSDYMQKEIDSNRNTTERILTSQTPQLSYGGQANTGTEAPSFTNQRRMNAKVQCAKCGRLNKADDLFCSSCGNPLPEENSNRCHNCGTTLDQDYSFCPKCGAKQIAVCKRCGLEVPSSASFCPSCGEKLASEKKDSFRQSGSSGQMEKDPHRTLSGRFENTVISLSNLDFIHVRKGTFFTGDTNEESEINSARCELTYDFSISKFQTTFADYDKYCHSSGIEKPGDEGWGREQRPVINVSWFDAIEFCNWLSKSDGLPKAYDFYGTLLDANGDATTDPSMVIGYRLPTEAEWEYAARGGNKSQGYKYAGSDNADEVAWYASNSGNKTQEVGKKVPNELGIYDMSGNVWEWCSDWWDSSHFSKSQITNPHNSKGSSYRVIRGGSWGNGATRVRVAGRSDFSPADTDSDLGFRVCRTVSD